MATGAIDYSEIKSILKEALIEILQERRDLFQDIFLEVLGDLNAGRSADETDVHSEEEEVVPTVEDIVAQIKATPPNPDTIIHGAKVGDMAYVQELIDNPPTDTVSQDDWERLWPKHEAEMKALDIAQALAEGRS